MKVVGRGAEYSVVHLISPKDQMLVEFLEAELSLRPQRIAELVWLGAIYVNEQRLDLPNATDFSKRHFLEMISVQGNVRVHMEPRRFYNGFLRDRVVQSHPEYYIVDKPSGLPSHALVDNHRENLLTLLSLELGEPLFITHRLDIETSGLMVIARNRDAQARINEKIKVREVKRFYEAWVETPLTIGTQTHFMKPSPKAPKEVSVTPHLGWAICELNVLSCVGAKHESFSQDLYKLEIELVTGRSQQIRAQLKALGAPILGDSAYGSKLILEDPLTQARAIGLRACRLTGL